MMAQLGLTGGLPDASAGIVARRFRRNFAIALAKAIGWTAVVSGVGLVQIWVLFLMKIFTLHFEMPNLIRDGVLLFFVMALVAATAIEYYFSDEPRLSRGVEGVLFILIPLVTVLFVVAAYAGTYLVGEANFNSVSAAKAQYWSLAIGLLYGVVAKGIVYLNLGME